MSATPPAFRALSPVTPFPTIQINPTTTLGVENSGSNAASSAVNPTLQGREGRRSELASHNNVLPWSQLDQIDPTQSHLVIMIGDAFKTDSPSITLADNEQIRSLTLRGQRDNCQGITDTVSWKYLCDVVEKLKGIRHLSLHDFVIQNCFVEGSKLNFTQLQTLRIKNVRVATNAKENNFLLSFLEPKKHLRRLMLDQTATEMLCRIFPTNPGLQFLQMGSPSTVHDTAEEENPTARREM